MAKTMLHCPSTLLMPRTKATESQEKLGLNFCVNLGYPR